MVFGRKGMEVSINMIVAIIMGLVMFIAGTAIFFNIYESATELPDNVDERMREQIMNRFDRGDRIYVYDSSLSFDNNGEAIYYIGLNNLLDNGDTTFKINVETTDNVNAVHLEEIELSHGERDIFIVILQNEGVERRQQESVNLTVIKNNEQNNENDYARRILYVQN